jgi:hypothetical protein
MIVITIIQLKYKMAEEQVIITSTKPIPIIKQTQKKPRKTLYWGIELSVDEILTNETIKKLLDDKQHLIPLEKMHTTLLYVGKKDDERENEYTNHRGKKCTITINHFGISDFALALNVNEMKFIDDHSEIVPTHAPKQHVTVALAEGIKAMNSINAFDEGMIVQLDESLIIHGKFYQYFF